MMKHISLIAIVNGIRALPIKHYKILEFGLLIVLFKKATGVTVTHQGMYHKRNPLTVTEFVRRPDE